MRASQNRHQVSGLGTVYTYTVVRHATHAALADHIPYVIAIVELAEGPRMMTNITGIPNTPEDLILDMELQVTFEQRGEISLPIFMPARDLANGAGA